MFLYIAALLYVARIVIYSSKLDCTNYKSHMGATFDLSELIRETGQTSYMVEDGDIPCTAQMESNFTYLFNVCNQVVGSYPKICNTVENIAVAGAIQINKLGTPSENDDYCYVVGDYYPISSEALATTLELYDSEDPTKGLALTYYGNICEKTNKNRKFFINLLCAENFNPVPTHALEYTTCEYNVTMPSVYGCPLECPVANRKLCSGNGHCAYDYDNNAAKCFCNHGYNGADCSLGISNDVKLNYSPALLGLIITLFVIVSILVVSIIFMVRQLAAYKDDLLNYRSLRGNDISSHNADL